MTGKILFLDSSTLHNIAFIFFIETPCTVGFSSYQDVVYSPLPGLVNYHNASHQNGKSVVINHLTKVGSTKQKSFSKKLWQSNRNRTRRPIKPVEYELVGQNWSAKTLTLIVRNATQKRVNMTHGYDTKSDGYCRNRIYWKQKKWTQEQGREFCLVFRG